MSEAFDHDLVSEPAIAEEYGESALTWRNRRLRGEGPPFIKVPGKRGVLYSRRDAAEYYAQFRIVPPITARRMEELQRARPAQNPQPSLPRPRSVRTQRRPKEALKA
jgi:hypothetical protein